MFGLFVWNCLVFWFWSLQPLLIFYQTIYFCQTTSLLTNIYCIGNLLNLPGWIGITLLTRCCQSLHHLRKLQGIFKSWCLYINYNSHCNINPWWFGGGWRRPWCQRIEKVSPGINKCKIQCCGSLSIADTMVSCKRRVGITLTNTDYFGKMKHVWQTNIISAKRLVLAN